MSRPKIAVAAVGLLCLAACGTTVPQTTAPSGSTGVSSGQAGGDSLGGAAAPDASQSAAGSAAGPTTAVTTSTTGGLGDESSLPGDAGGATTAGTTTRGSTPAAVGTGATSTGPTTRSAGGRPAKGTKATTGSKSAPSTTGTSTTKGTTSTSTSAGTTGTANGPGITPTTISIGFVYSPNADAGLKTLGINIDEGNTLDEMNAFAAQINHNGGIAGRMLKIVPYSYGNNTTDSFASQEEAACTALTQDTPTFGILAGYSPTFAACTAKAGILSFGTDVNGISTADYAKYQQRFDVSSLPMEPAATALVSALSSDGYLTTKWDTTTGAAGGVNPVKVGILYNDSPEEGAFVKTLIAGLAAKGVKVDPSDVIQYNQSTSASGDGAEISAIEASALQFRSDGVTDFVPVDAAALGFFAPNANSQKYYPRYAMTSVNEPQADATAGTVPAATLAGAVGFGWFPPIDLTDYSAFENPGQAMCRKALSDASIQDAPNSLQEVVAFGMCDDLYVLKRGADAIKAGGPVTVRSVIAGIQAIGTNFPFANLPSGTYTSNRSYPVYQGYPLAWDAGCGCAKYTGPAYKL